MKTLIGMVAVLMTAGIVSAAEPDWKLRALEAEVKVATLEAENARLKEENRVVKSWLEAKLKASMVAATKDAQAALKEYRKKTKQEKPKNEKAKPSNR